MTIDEKEVSNTISIDRATPVPSHNTNANLGDGRNAKVGEREIIKEYQAPEGEFAKGKWCGADDTNALPTPEANELTALTKRASPYIPTSMMRRLTQEGTL